MSDTVTLTRAEYQDLIDARDHAIAMREIATGATETFSEEEARAYVAASSPLQFWRQRRGRTQSDLAAAAGLSQAHLAMAESGRRGLSIESYRHLAKALGVRIDDLAPDEG